jgi:putative oxygen-independent coproporphyrinogen III oxidase
MQPGFAIYIHWPFCLSRCPYCDFNAHVAEDVDHRRWRRALAAELAHFASETVGRTVTSIHFGGGTPSLMEPATVATLIEAAGTHWTLADDLEITLEANPSSVEARRFTAFAEAGVNRLSLGVQSFDDAALAFLGRGHSADEARRALELAGRTFRRVSFDLIYARPGQTADAWQVELSDALSFETEHLSLYQLTIERGTPFHKEGIEAAGEEQEACLFDITRDVLTASGLPAYEVSNHARPGAESHHNLNYWLGGDYAGIGPGAHGRLSANHQTDAIRQIPPPQSWIGAVEAKGHGTAARVSLKPGERRDELVMMGLRLDDGLDRQRFRLQTGGALEDAVDGAALARLTQAGFLTLDGQGLRATPLGLPRLNALIAALLVS